ncbi:MAG: hypothetical protein ABI665_16310 [Vicinamibacterales bacterium]
MTRRLLLVVLVSLAAAGVDARQSTTPQPTKPQRETLRAIIAAVDQAVAAPETPGVDWPVHLMRASDGSHYVAFTVNPPPATPLPAGPVMLYIRLATAAPSSAQSLAERSTVSEWLAGKRSDPLMKPKSGFVPGEMPNFGAGGIAVRGSTPSSGSNDLSLMAMERARARQEKEDYDRQRKAELEGLEKANRNLLPFEDFDLSVAVPADVRAIQRALTAGPGDYELYVGWADASTKPPAVVRVVKRQLHLPPASTTELMLSTVIVADRVAVREVAYSAEEQRAHPYTIGATDIIPARDSVFARDERIAVAFQVINAHASEAGKPDVSINFRIVRVLQDRETPVASLTPQRYHDLTLPADFDLRLGHPIFAAVSAPLATIPRGEYRLKILAADHIAGTTTSADADFSVVGTPLTLLAEAPPLGQPFKHESVLTPDLLRATVQGLRLPTASPELTRALDLAERAQFVDLLREEPLAPAEQGVRIALTALALYSVGDATSSSVQLQRALQLNAPAGGVQFLLGAARALQGRDADAIAAWQAAIDAGMPARSVTPLLVDAYLRRGDAVRAAALLATEPSDSKNGPWIRARAAMLIASGHEGDAVALLQSRLAVQADDLDAAWLLVHALFATVVRAPAGTTPPNLDAFTTVARDYVARDGAHAALAKEWLGIVRK